jgi:hypothetical protein
VPVLVRWYLKTAFVYFFAGLGLGVLQSVGGLVDFLPPGLPAVIYHLLMVGWVTQMILGIAIWMFPKFSQSQPRGNEKLAWTTYFLLNTGLIFRVIAEPLNTAFAQQLWGWILVVSAFLQWLAGALIVGTMWRRVKLK